jgi:hypothetical protein
VDVMPRPIVPDPPAAFDDDGIGPEELALGPPAVRPSQKPGSAARALSCVLNFGWAFWTLLTRIFSNPTIRAAMLAFVLGVIPPIKALFVGPGETPLSPMLAAIQILGQAQVSQSVGRSVTSAQGRQGGTADAPRVPGRAGEWVCRYRARC